MRRQAVPIKRAKRSAVMMLIFDILFSVWFLAPFMAIGIGFIVLFTIRMLKHTAIPWAPLNGLVLSAVFTVAFYIYGWWVIDRRGYNLGPPMLPVFGFVAALGAFVAGWSTSNIISFVRDLLRGAGSGVRSVGHIARVVLSVLLLLFVVRGFTVIAHGEYREIKAESSSTDVKKLRKMFGEAKAKHHVRILEALARNEGCPPDILEELGMHESRSIRQEVASNPGASLELLSRLANDENETVRCRVAYNPHTAAKILRKLSEDAYSGTRVRVAHNPNTPDDILHNLMSDDYWAVRKHVALNPRVSDEILSLLSRDSNQYVRGEAIRRLEADKAMPRTDRDR